MISFSMDSYQQIVLFKNHIDRFVYNVDLEAVVSAQAFSLLSAVILRGGLDGQFHLMCHHSYLTKTQTLSPMLSGPLPI